MSNDVKLFWRRGRLRLALGLALLLSLLTTPVALASHIAIDGNFGDWSGLPPFWTDPAGDVTPPRVDVTAFYWTSDPGVPITYFMIQRTYPGGQGSQKVFYRIFVDKGCNGSFSDAVDRTVVVTYDPTTAAGTTTVDVFTGTGTSLGPGLGIGDPIGSAPNGGTRTEVSVPNLTLDQADCMFVGSYQTASDQTAVDASGSIQIPALGYMLLALVVIGVVNLVWRRRAFAAWGQR